MSEQKPYIVSARKYRPATFKTVVGQRALTSTLKNALGAGRLAQAYLFCGPRGVGKTSCARIFAKTINCMNPTPDGEACGECESCKAIELGNSFNLVELDAASNNSVDDIRTITEQVNIPPQQGNYRVFIIDEVHMLSNSAFNAFLKTLEEPPKNVVFILATTEKHKVIPTILSRCQIYDFKRITVNDIIDHLAYVAEEEGVKAEREALGVIALKADGAMRDALSIFDQVVASTAGNVTYQSTLDNLNVLDQDYYFRLIDAFIAGDAAEALMIYKEIRDKGFDSQFFINGLASHVRDLTMAIDSRTKSLLETSEEIAAKYVEYARKLPLAWYYSALKILNDADLNYRVSSNKRLLVELALIRLSELLSPHQLPRSTKQESPGAEKKNYKSEVSSQSTAGQQVSEPIGPEKEARSESLNKGGNVESVVEGNGSSEKANYRFSQQPAPQKNKVEGKLNDVNVPRQSATVRPSSFRISAVGGDALKKTAFERRTNKFNNESFMISWNRFITQNPQLQILINAMRSAEPEASEDFTYIIKVDHPAQRQAFEMSMSKLLTHLRDDLENDLLTLRVELNDVPKEQKKMAPREFLKNIHEQNPPLADLIIKIEGEII